MSERLEEKVGFLYICLNSKKFCKESKLDFNWNFEFAKWENFSKEINCNMDEYSVSNELHLILSQKPQCESSKRTSLE
jgi:hypothetical protein